jgi:hypothetical protein
MGIKEVHGDQGGSDSNATITQLELRAFPARFYSL